MYVGITFNTQYRTEMVLEAIVKIFNNIIILFVLIYLNNAGLDVCRSFTVPGGQENN